MTPDLSEYKPPSAANTKGVANRMVENRSDRVRIWRIDNVSGQLIVVLGGQ